MFERFTDRARRVTVLSQDQARALNHNWIGTEHLLLAMIAEGESPVSKALIRIASYEQFRDAVVGRRPVGTETPTGHIPFTPRAKKVLELAMRESLQMGTTYIGVEHLLLGLLREGDGIACRALADLGAETQLPVVRERLRRSLEDRLDVTLHPAEPDGPEDGHTFRITVSSRGSYGIVGVEGYTDASDFGPPWTMDVRAWNLRDALRKALEAPFDTWDTGEDE